MALSRMDDSGLPSIHALANCEAPRRPSPFPIDCGSAGGGFNWRPLAIGSAVVFALVVGVFLAALVSELV